MKVEEGCGPTDVRYACGMKSEVRGI